MTAITPCTNELCPLAKECLRAQSIPSYRQSMDSFRFINLGDKVKCDEFIKNETGLAPVDWVN